MALCLTACGSSSASGGSNDAAAIANGKKGSSAAVTADKADFGAGAIPEEGTEIYDTADAAAQDDVPSAYQKAEVKLIRRATIQMETTAFEQAKSGIEALVESVGGYIENSDFYQGHYGSSWRSVSYTIRVPSEKYNVFLTGMQQNTSCHLLSQEESTEDVGTQYFDAENRLKTLRTKLERLQALLKEAKKMEDIITLQSAISETEYQIDQYASDLKRYDSLIGYATFYVSIDMVANLTDTNANPFTQRLKDAFVAGLDNFTLAVQNVVLFVVGNLLQIIVWIAVLLGLRKLVLFVRSRRATRAVEHPERKWKFPSIGKRKNTEKDETTSNDPKE